MHESPSRQRIGQGPHHRLQVQPEVCPLIECVCEGIPDGMQNVEDSWDAECSSEPSPSSVQQGVRLLG